MGACCSSALITGLSFVFPRLVFRDGKDEECGTLAGSGRAGGMVLWGSVIYDRNVAEAAPKLSFLPLTRAISVSLSNEQLKLKAKLKETWLHLGLVRSLIQRCHCHIFQEPEDVEDNYPIP